MIKKLIRCDVCNQVVPCYETFGFNQASSLPGVEWAGADLDGRREFMLGHFGHPLEELSIDPDSFISDKPGTDPVRTSYFIAGNGDRQFLIRRTKPALDQSAGYEIIPGRLQVSNVSLRIQESDLRKQIAASTQDSPLPEEKVQGFIQGFREEVESISPEAFEAKAEMTEEGETPLVLYSGLSESRWEKILDRCREDFQLDSSEFDTIKRFVEENREPWDVLALRIERRFSILEGPEEGRRVGVPQSQSSIYFPLHA